MYSAAYSETMLDAPQEQRAREQQAVLKSIELMELAEAAGIHSREAMVALNFLRSLWTIFIEDLADHRNQLNPLLRAQLISIGLSIMRQAEDLRMERQTTFVELIHISRLIMEGLR